MNLWRIILFAAVPLAVGGLSSLITGDAMISFRALRQPFLSPPGWLFPVVWTILYILMGLASYLIDQVRREEPAKSRAASNWLVLYGISLFFNFCWSPVFFNLHWYWFAFLWLMAMWAMILVLVIKAKFLSKAARDLMVPYLIWVTFAAYLNIGIAILN